MTLSEGKRLGAVRVEGGWELIIRAFTQRDGSHQPSSRVFWPDKEKPGQHQPPTRGD